MSIAVVLVFICFIPKPPWRTTWIDMCPECGSTRTQVTTWFGRYTAKPVVYSSCIDRWIVAHEGSHAHKWQFLCGSDSNGACYCGTAPATYSFGHGTFDKEFACVSDNDVAKLVLTLHTGTDAQQEQAVQAFLNMLIRMPIP
jgi:hypothetical protein